MARLDDLIAQIPDPSLRQSIQSAVSDLKRRQQFGLVFEEHIPETTALYGLPVKVGSLVQRRDDASARVQYRVIELTDDDRAKVEPADGGHAEEVPAHSLLVVEKFGEPVYPALVPLGAVRCGPSDKPHHAVINGENFHALQLLLYLYEGQVDCIYIDPPYNTGSRDWKYNNRYIDDNDTWRHSKWLSYMKKRLVLSKRLLKRDGVIIVTIDEHEVLNLGMLLEQVFPEYLRYMVTIVNNPKGTYKQNFGRVDEQAFFVVPNTGADVIVPRVASTNELDRDDFVQDLLRKLVKNGSLTLDLVHLDAGSLEPEERKFVLDAVAEEDGGPQATDETDGDAVSLSPEYEDWFLRRRGQESSYRRQRPNQFYAILVNERLRKVVGIGPHLEKDEAYQATRDGDIVTVYPIDNEGRERVWRYSRQTMQAYIAAGEIVVGSLNKATGSWTLNHRKLKKEVRRHKTVWWEKAHDAGVHGTNVVNRLLGKPGLFPFPKSVYAVRDALAAVVRTRPDALIVDFFAGSGTTLHATCLLNAADGGRRRCVLVTNNEVSESTATALSQAGHYRGDPAFEARGIFEQVTRPRCEAAITGLRPDGTPIPGSHIGGRPFSQGFSENAEFFRLSYVDPDEVDLGHKFDAILPCLWLTAGGVGAREGRSEGQDFVIPAGSNYGVLFRESRFRQFLSALHGYPGVTHVWLATDSDEAFAEMRSALPRHIAALMLYGDYLRKFRTNLEPSR